MHEIATVKVMDIREKAPQEMFDIGVKDWHNFVLRNQVLSANCVHTILRLSQFRHPEGKMDIPLGLHKQYAICITLEKARNSVYGLKHNEKIHFVG